MDSSCWNCEYIKTRIEAGDTFRAGSAIYSTDFESSLMAIKGGEDIEKHCDKFLEYEGDTCPICKRKYVE
jgi:hypothetical protein